MTVRAKLKDLAPGTVFNAGPIDVRVLEHFTDGRTLLIADTCIADRHFADQPFKTIPEKPAANPNDWRFSNLNRELNTEFLATFDQAEGPIRSKDILTADWSLADHEGGEGYGTIQAKIALLTQTMYEKYADQDLLELDDWWWLITPYASNAGYARDVYTDGSLSNGSAYFGSRGVRPALYLESGNLVSDSTDTDGAYILQWNQPPSDPSSISYGTPQAGNSLVLSTGGSTDPEGDAISYVWERKIDSGAYVQLGITTAKTFTDTVPTSGTTYTARVKAVDANGLESGYCTGSAKTISYNTPPVISGSDQNLGAKTAPFTYQYTVTDAQAATQTITVTEKLTNGTQTITLRTYTATSGAQNTVDLSSVWLSLLSGTHVLTITATDSAGGSATRKITFSRTVSRIAAARAFNTDALVQKVFVSLYPATIPADATLHLEVTNNPFDTSPVWVDITDKANRLVHVFTNTTAAKGYGLGYRFYITKGTQEIEITQATIRFA